MKTMKLKSEVRRFSEKEATDRVKQGWKFCPKSEWKNITVEPVVSEKKETKLEETKPIGNPKGKAKKEFQKRNK